MEIEDTSNEIIVFDTNQFPDKPSPDKFPLLPNIRPIGYSPDIIVNISQSIWQITARFTKIQAKDTVQTVSIIYLGAKTSRSIQLNTMVYCDELADPIKKVLSVAVYVEESCVELKDLLQGDWWGKPHPTS